MENDQADAVEENLNDSLLDALDDSPPEEIIEETPDDEERLAEPEVSQKFRVKIKNDAGADEEKDLTLEELAAGYMQSADYTRKTQAIAAQDRQRQEQYYNAVQQTAQQAQQQLAALQQVVIAAAAPELGNVNWQQLAMEDPARYVQLQARQQQLQNVLAHIEAQDAELKRQREATERQQREQAIQHSRDYLNREIPGFNLEKEAPKLMETGKSYGFSEQELANVIDGRMLHVLYEAAQWRQLQAQKPKALQKVADAPKVIKPAAPQPKKPNQSALERLKKTGRPSELVNFL